MYLVILVISVISAILAIDLTVQYKAILVTIYFSIEVIFMVIDNWYNQDKVIYTLLVISIPSRHCWFSLLLLIRYRFPRIKYMRNNLFNCAMWKT